MTLKENETLELKRSTSELKEAVISIGAILNKHGRGRVFFGIADDGRVVGRHIGRATLKDISQAISAHIDPRIYPDIEARSIEGKSCIIVDFSGHDGLYSAFGRFYLRSGDEDRKLSAREIARLVEKKKNYAYSWGTELSGSGPANSDGRTLRSFVKRGRDAGRINFSFDSARNVLAKLHLIKDGQLLNAGRALFGKDNVLEVQAALFAGKDKITFLDIQSFHGNILQLAARSEAYIKEHMNWRADLTGSHRVEIPEVPVRAVREAIINSLCHRDFENPKSNEIAIYKDRIEIFNPGHFPGDYSPEDFIKGSEPSIPRNPLIAETLFRSEDIEKWGSGLKRISQECRAAGVKVSFKRIKSGFTVVFFRPGFKKVGGVTDTVGGVNVGVNGGINGGTNGGINILEAEIKKNPGKRLPALSVALKIPSRTVEKWLEKLKEAGRITYRGSKKTGGYFSTGKKGD